jgi:hypothetical protein
MKRTVTPLYRMRPRQRSIVVRECEQLVAELCRLTRLPGLELELVSTSLPLDRKQECLLGYYLHVTRRAHIFFDRCLEDGVHSLRPTIVHEFGHHVQHHVPVPAWHTTRDEDPPTEYAESSQSEDISESIMLWAFDPQELERVAPVRAAIIESHPNLCPLRGLIST